MTRAPPFLPFFWSVYLADAREFTSPAQDGVVLLLMIAIWQAGGSLPFNKKKLAQITRQTPEQWQAMWPLIRTHFRRHSGSVSHDGVTAGLENYWARARARGAGQVPKPRQVRAKSKRVGVEIAVSDLEIANDVNELTLQNREEVEEEQRGPAASARRGGRPSKEDWLQLLNEVGRPKKMPGR